MMRRNVAGDMYDLWITDLHAGRVRNRDEYTEIRETLDKLAAEETEHEYQMYPSLRPTA